MSTPTRRIYVGLPAFNEEVAIDRLLQKISRVADTGRSKFIVVVYNDGSTDQTADVALSWQSKLSLVLRGRMENLGLGAGLTDLIDYAVAVGQPEDLLIVMDCDDTHDPDQIPTMLSAQEAGNDVVIASRFSAGATVSGVPLMRRIAALGAMVLIKAIHPIAGVMDYTCSYRVYQIGLLQQAKAKYGTHLVTEHGFACMVEVLMKLDQLKARMTEIPLRLRYDLKPSPSKMHVGLYIRRLLYLLITWRLKNVRSRFQRRLSKKGAS